MNRAQNPLPATLPTTPEYQIEEAGLEHTTTIRTSNSSLAIRGTRHILPSGRFLPRLGRIDIHVLPSVGPMRDMKSSEAVIYTRDPAHARILAAFGEPDLSANDGIAALQSRRS